MSESEPSLREELVKQNGASRAVDAELANLQQVIEAERQRGRRLARWTKIVWITAVALLLMPLLLTVIYMALSRAPQPRMPAPVAATQATTNPAATQAAAASAAMLRAREMSRREAAAGAIMLTLFLLAVPMSLILIVIGIVLMIMTFVARRTAGMHEIRASLASIDAQLRLLALAPTLPGADKEAKGGN